MDWLGEARLRERAASVDAEETKKKLHELASRGEFEKFLAGGAAASESTAGWRTRPALRLAVFIWWGRGREIRNC